MVIPSIPHITVLLETSRQASRRRFRGILRYVRLHQPWCLNFVVGGVQELALPDSQEVCDGIITTTLNLEMVRQLLTQKCPIVLLDPEKGLREYPILRQFSHVSLDNAAVGRMGAEYFLQNNYQHFAFVEPAEPWNWAVQRKKAFVETLRKEGATCHIYASSPQRNTSPEKERTFLGNWLQTLPTPLAVLGASDIEGRQVIDACLALGKAVPYEVAVLGVGDDDFICESCFPSLSSIAVEWQEAGYLAASFLHAHMTHPHQKKQSATYAPTQIIHRISTEKALVTDQLIIQILERIRLANGMNLRVNELAREFHVSRQWLDKRFKQLLGHTVYDEVQKRRLEKIRTLIAETHLSFNQIATLCGFENGNYLRNLFKKAFGMTMTEYREKSRSKIL
ncbi:MAG: XylR family transcriptional regulator [Planctomycetia bacterium]|nr:XylR family transcriptional regulator [Planctomycetia bacterium]